MATPASPAPASGAAASSRLESYITDPADPHKLVLDTTRRGVGGDSFFCTLVDAYTWAVSIATHGARLNHPKEIKHV